MFSAAGGGIGLAVGAAAVPLTLAVMARPPLRTSTTAPTAGVTASVAWQRPAGVIVPIVACGLTGARIGPGWVLVAFLALGVGLSAAGLVDARWRLLPKRVVYPTWAAGLVGMAVAAAVHHHYAPLLGAVAAGGGLFVVFALVTLLAPKAMAFGDVRLAGVVGSALGWWGLGTVALGLIIGFIAASVFSVALIGLGRLARDAPLPLGSWLAFGAGVAIWVVA